MFYSSTNLHPSSSSSLSNKPSLQIQRSTIQPINLNRSRLQYRQQLASNLIQLSNIQYLMKYTKYDKFDPVKIYQNALVEAEGLIEKDMMEKQKQKIGNNYKQYGNQIATSNYSKKPLYKLLQSNKIKYQKFTPQVISLHQQRISQTIKHSILKSLQKRPTSHHLSRQQILHLAQQKIRKSHLLQQKQLQKSRRSYEYIESIKRKIQDSILEEEEIEVTEFEIGQIIKDEKEIFAELERLEKARYNIKMKYYYYEKEDYKPDNSRNRANNFNKNPKLIQLYNQLYSNLKTARSLYNQYFHRSQSLHSNKKPFMHSPTSNINILSNSIKVLQTSNNNLPNSVKKTQHLLAKTPLNITSQQTVKKNFINRIQKHLNSILLDQREIKLIQNQLFQHQFVGQRN